jgi:hypothetical protein
MAKTKPTEKEITNSTKALIDLMESYGGNQIWPPATFRKCYIRQNDEVSAGKKVLLAIEGDGNWKCFKAVKNAQEFNSLRHRPAHLPSTTWVEFSVGSQKAEERLAKCMDEITGLCASEQASQS